MSFQTVESRKPGVYSCSSMYLYICDGTSYEITYRESFAKNSIIDIKMSQIHV